MYASISWLLPMACPGMRFFVISAASALMKAGMFPDAIRYFEKHLHINPESEYVCNNIGNCYYALGGSRDAMKAYTRALRINTEHAASLNYFANSLQELGS